MDSVKCTKVHLTESALTYIHYYFRIESLSVSFFTHGKVYYYRSPEATPHAHLVFPKAQISLYRKTM